MDSANTFMNDQNSRTGVPADTARRIFTANEPTGLSLKAAAGMLRSFADKKGVSFSVDNTAEIIAAMSYSRLLLLPYGEGRKQEECLRYAAVLRNFFGALSNSVIAPGSLKTARDALVRMQGGMMYKSDFYQDLERCGGSGTVKIIMMFAAPGDNLAPWMDKILPYLESPRENAVYDDAVPGQYLPHNIWFVLTVPDAEMISACGEGAFETAAVLHLDGAGISRREVEAAQSLQMSPDEFEDICEEAMKTLILPDEKDWRKIDALDKTLRGFCRNGLGHICRNHIEAFVPVVKACEGHEKEALDSLLADRLRYVLSGPLLEDAVVPDAGTVIGSIFEPGEFGETCRILSYALQQN